MGRRPLLVGAVLLTVAGCSGPPAPAPPTTSTVDPVRACASQIVYWVKDLLSNAKDTGLDYQEMGLDGDQYEAVLRIVEAGRGMQTSAPNTFPRWLQDQATAACQQLASKSPSPTTSGGFGWPGN